MAACVAADGRRMALNLPSGRRGRLLALGLLVVLALLFGLGVVEPAVDFYAARGAHIERQARMVRQMARIAAELPDLRDQAARSSHGSAGAMLPGDSDPAAAAWLQEQVQTLASAAGAALSSVEVLPAEQAGAHRRIALRIGAQATWPAVVGILAQAADAEPPLLIDDLQIRAAPAAGADQPAMLDAAFTIYGFRRAAQP